MIQIQTTKDMYTIDSSLSVALFLLKFVVPLQNVEMTFQIVTDVKYVMGVMVFFEARIPLR